ncbi:MAG: DUF255 domain-containing protein [Saprospiraceae bacterium]
MSVHRYLLVIIAIFIFQACSNKGKDTSLEWKTIQDIEKIRNTSGLNKPMMIDVYTDWCKWCKVMDKETFTNKEVIDYINTHFYAVKFDAEQKENAVFNGQSFAYQTSGRSGANMLAVNLLRGDLSFPSIVYLDKHFNIIQVSPGYKTPEQLLAELQKLVP